MGVARWILEAPEGTMVHPWSTRLLIILLASPWNNDWVDACAPALNNLLTSSEDTTTTMVVFTTTKMDMTGETTAVTTTVLDESATTATTEVDTTTTKTTAFTATTILGSTTDPGTTTKQGTTTKAATKDSVTTTAFATTTAETLGSETITTFVTTEMLDSTTDQDTTAANAATTTFITTELLGSTTTTTDGTTTAMLGSTTTIGTDGGDGARLDGDDVKHGHGPSSDGASLGCVGGADGGGVEGQWGADGDARHDRRGPADDDADDGDEVPLQVHLLRRGLRRDGHAHPPHGRRHEVTARMTNWITGGVTGFYQYLWGTRLVRHCLARNNSSYKCYVLIFIKYIYLNKA